MRQEAPQFHVTIKDGGMAFNSEFHKAQFKRYLRTLEGKHCILAVEPKRNTRTHQQNAYYWGAYLPLIVREMGDDDVDAQTLHEHFRQCFLLKGMKKVRGKEVRIYRSSTELSVGEFQHLIRQIEAMTGIPAPSTEMYDHAPLIEQ